MILHAFAVVRYVLAVAAFPFLPAIADAATLYVSNRGVDSPSWANVITSWESKTAKRLVMPTPRSATSASLVTGTVRERGMPLLSAQEMVIPATSFSTSSRVSASRSDTAG